MKFQILLLALISPLLVMSDDEYISPVTGQAFDPAGKFSLDQIKIRDERVLKKTGGFLLQKAEGPQAMFVDTRKAPSLTVNEVARLYKLGTHLDCMVDKVSRNDNAPFDFAQNIMRNKKPLLVVIVVEDAESLPALSVFPEERIGIVNADKLKNDSPDPSAPEMRVAKEIWRAMGFISGIGFSAQENDMMQPYYTLKEIDANNYPYIQPMNMAKMQKMWKRFGVKKEARVPYRIACQQGWANAPTNEYQKAVWEEVHAIPQDPIKIQFDNTTKKGKVTK